MAFLKVINRQQMVIIIKDPTHVLGLPCLSPYNYQNKGKKMGKACQRPGLRMPATFHMQWFLPYCCEAWVDVNHQIPGLLAVDIQRRRQNMQ